MNVRNKLIPKFNLKFIVSISYVDGGQLCVLRTKNNPYYIYEFMNVNI